MCKIKNVLVSIGNDIGEKSVYCLNLMWNSKMLYLEILTLSYTVWVSYRGFTFLKMFQSSDENESLQCK